MIKLTQIIRYLTCGWSWYTNESPPMEHAWNKVRPSVEDEIPDSGLPEIIIRADLVHSQTKF